MSYFDQIHRKLFGKAGTRKVSVEDLINRSQSFLSKLEKWKASDHCAEVLNDIWQSYFWTKKGIEKTPSVFLHESNHSNGLAINFSDSGLDKRDFHYLFDLLKDQVKQLGYMLITSKVSMREKGDDVETREMHYLKPRRSFAEPIDQKYGNVLIEYFEINEAPTLIKLVANTYPDRNYKKPQSFESLTKYLFTKTDTI